MIDFIEENLRKRLSDKRSLEMKKYGRIKLYDEVSFFLEGDNKTAFSLINHALAIIDDNIDASTNTEQLDRAKEILIKSFNNEETYLNLDWEKDIYQLGKILSKLYKDGFVYAEDIFDEVINYWNIEKKNLNRKGKILNSRDLDELNLEIGKSVGIQFLCLLCPELNKQVISQTATLYGFSIKLADNLSDLKEDFKKGYINISKENIRKYNLKLDSSEKEMLPYILIEFKRVKDYYERADEEVEEILKQNNSSKNGLLIFKEIAHSWLNQVSEIYNSK